MRISLRTTIKAEGDRQIVFWRGFDPHPRLGRRRRTVKCSLMEGESEVSLGVAYLRPGQMREYDADMDAFFVHPPDKFDLSTGQSIAFKKAIAKLKPREVRAPFWRAWLRKTQGLVLDPPKPQPVQAAPSLKDEPAPLQPEMEQATRETELVKSILDEWF